MPVRQLSPQTINRIAAGEVVERPASVVKELVENALDAGARDIEVVTAGGGLSLIRISDDGHGMAAADLVLAVERHATSKLDDEDLFDIRTLGFRGEALPSIGSIAELTITTRATGAREAIALTVDRGAKGEVRPAAHNRGTRVEVRELFSATPARLKFMKSEPAENRAIGEVVKRLAMAHPAVAFTVVTGERAGLKLPAASDDAAGRLDRLGRIMGREFMADAIAIDGGRDGVRVAGFAGLPTLNRPDVAMQFLFVNGRPVRDKVLLGALRAAYGDTVPKGRHPLVALFIDLDPREVDVNVHPAKVEVRFRDAGTVRSLIIGGLREALARAGHRATVAGGNATLDVLARGTVEQRGQTDGRRGQTLGSDPVSDPVRNRSHLPPGFSDAMQAPLDGLATPSADTAAAAMPPASARPRPPARRRPRAVARDLHRRRNPRRHRHRRPARRARAPRLRAAEGGAGQRRRGAAGPADPRDRRARRRRRRRAGRCQRRARRARALSGAVRADGRRRARGAGAARQRRRRRPGQGPRRRPAGRGRRAAA